MRASLRVDFTTIQMQCHDLSHTVSGEAGDVFGLAIRGLDGLKESREILTPVTALEATGAEQLAEIDV